MVLTLVLLSTVTVTSYRPVPAQTKPECTSYYHCQTASGENVNEGGVAVSQDLLKSGVLRFGDYVYIEKYGLKRVNDTMNARHRMSIDIFVKEKIDEKRIGVRHLKLWKVGERK
jgi:3D (Asp-Asp-Asp) domain-containing protein